MIHCRLSPCVQVAGGPRVAHELTIPPFGGTVGFQSQLLAQSSHADDRPETPQRCAPRPMLELVMSRTQGPQPSWILRREWCATDLKVISQVPRLVTAEKLAQQAHPTHRSTKGELTRDARWATLIPFFVVWSTVSSLEPRRS